MFNKVKNFETISQFEWKIKINKLIHQSKLVKE